MPDGYPVDQVIPREHRAGAWLILLVGVAGIGLGIYQWRSGIVTAFENRGPVYKSADQLEAERIEAMKTKDTDGDGLTDYEEVYIYHTSPYLSDSDGDGIPDGVEVRGGTDPNCPEGKTCGPLGSYQPPGTISASSTGQTASDQAVQDAAQQQAIEQMMNPTVDQIRQLLIGSGAKKEDVDKIDDDTLKTMYQQALIEAQLKSSQQPSQNP